MAYEVKGVTTKITATSRCAIKIRDNYYTCELSEERAMPESSEIDLNKEYEALFDSINSEIDRQIQDIVNTFAKK
jgi:hypothetical protein